MSVMVLVSFPNLTVVAITPKGELLEISLGLVQWSLPIYLIMSAIWRGVRGKVMLGNKTVSQTVEPFRLAF